MKFKLNGIEETDAKTTSSSSWNYTPTTISVPEPTKNINYGWICPKCGRVNSPLTPSCDCQKFMVRIIGQESGIPSACINCPNHSSNGGSGICYCILGSSEVIC